jgi:hypothetical protein
MRTTVDIEDDVLAAARSIAERRRQSLGKVLSDLARQALTKSTRSRKRNGVPLLSVKKGAEPVTPERIDELRDDEES